MSSIFGDKPVVGIIMGSESDMPTMEACMKQLEELDVPYEVKVASAHRKPAEVHEWASSAVERGIRVIIAAAGKAAHLGGVVAAYTPLPVIAVPMKTSDLGGLDSLLSRCPAACPLRRSPSTVQRMPASWLFRCSVPATMKHAPKLKSSKLTWPRHKRNQLNGKRIFDGQRGIRPCRS